MDKGYKTMLEEQKQAWANIWAMADITIDGDVIEGILGSISADGHVEISGKILPMDGLRSIVPSRGGDNASVVSDGRVVLICGSETAASGIKVLE